MNKVFKLMNNKEPVVLTLVICSTIIMAIFHGGVAAGALPQPVVAVHVSENTQALETMSVTPPTPTVPGTTGFEWWPAEWHYFVMYESLIESFVSDGTPFVEVSDADIAAGELLYPDGSPRYPIMISLASEAIADSAVAPLRDYVSAGGFLFIGSSSFTRNPDGTTRGDFALADEMALHMVNPELQNWGLNILFTKVVDHRLVSHIPNGTISWRMPLSSEEIPLGTSPGHAVHGDHYVFQVSASAGAAVIASGETGPLVTVTPYGNGNFIYHADMQPLIGHGVYDPSTYAYLIYRNAIEWAFEAANLPIIKLSPWQYDYNAAFIVRHDFENSPTSIRSIESSASFENALGINGDYYFCTGTLREEMPDRDTVIQSLRRAVTDFGATVGSHNGGLRNPRNPGLTLNDFDYWHWGPDEALDVTPAGYPDGRSYARESISLSIQDIEGWLAGVDNGRAGCGITNDCPRTWASPYFNSTREDSYEILEELGAVVMSRGEQKVGPFPHWTLSYETPGKRYYHVSLPASDWYVGEEIPGALEWGHTTDSMEDAVDFYYDLGAMINLYGHIQSSPTNLMGHYAQYCVSKPRMWTTNAVGISDWWEARSNVIVIPSYSMSGATSIAQASISGAIDPDTAIEVGLPAGDTPAVSNIQVSLDGVPATSDDYRMIGNTVKVRVGDSTSVTQVLYTMDNPLPVTTGLSPASAISGGPSFTLTVSGSGFVNGSMVRWNGLDRMTTFISSTQLTASITPEDIAEAGTASVTVFNPTPGGGASNDQIFTIGDMPGGTWIQTDWSGGGGQAVWADETRYDSAINVDDRVAGEISLAASIGDLFSDDFTRPPDSPDPLSPWVAAMGTWTVAEGVMQGSGPAMQYSYASHASAPQWTDYTVQGRIQIPAGSFGGGIGGRVDGVTGAHYGAWVYPSGSPGGSNLLKLWKFRSWTDLGAGVPMQQVSLPAVGTDWHTLQITFTGNRIQVYYGGTLRIDVTDDNFDSRAPYLSGGISADWWTWSLPYTIMVDDISVVTGPAYAGSGALVSSAFDGGDAVQWQTLSWDAVTPVGTDFCIETRTADSADQIATASWSGCYIGSGAAIMSGDRRWIQYRLELSTTNPSETPIIDEIRLSFVSGETAPIIYSLMPSAAPAGGPAFTLTVNGGSFISGSVVRWNGTDRTTTYVSSTELTASITVGDIATAGTADVTVFSPAPGGGISNTQPFTITVPDNPVPAATSLSPASAPAGGPAFTLTVNGGSFISGSVVRWNGTDRTTTYVSSTELTASITAGDIATAGTAGVTVFSPAPGGGVSNAQTFTINMPDTLLFQDDFTRPPGSPDPLLPWEVSMGTWSVIDGVMQGSGPRRQYSYAYSSGTPQWTDYSVQGSIRIPAGSFGGGIGGRLDPATGAHYAVWIYPNKSSGGSNVLKLWKFKTWTDIDNKSVPMQQVSMPDAGSGWHTLRMTFMGNRILVYYDGDLKINVTDDNYDSAAPYLSGGITLDCWPLKESDTVLYDNISVISR